MEALMKLQFRNDRLYHHRSVYITQADIADYGHHGACVKATGYFPDEIKEIKEKGGEVVYTEVPRGYIQRFADITFANATTEETEIEEGVWI